MVKFGLTWREIYASALKAIERKDKGFIGFRRLTEIAGYKEGM